MSEQPAYPPYLIQDVEQAPAVQGPSGIDCAQEVLSAYMTLMKTAHNEPRAFEHAVLTYQLRNPDATVEAARKAVAIIICSKP
jgi:hypothetical protein